MKKIIALLLAVVLCLGLTGCGKSEAVKNAEAKITAIASAEDVGAALLEAQEAYAAVSAEEQSKVKNAAELTAAVNAFLVDEWVLECSYIKNGDVVLSLTEDGKLALSQNQQTLTGTWAMEGDTVALNFDLGINGKSKLYVEDGYYKINSVGLLGESLVRKVDAEAAFAEKYVAVEITPENFGDYIGQPVKMDYDVVDEWGDVIKDCTAWIFPSEVYDDGLVYYDRSDDFAFEVKYKGDWSGDEAIWMPYDIIYWSYNNYYDAGQRAKGTIYYIKADYVEECYLDENDDKYLKLKDGTVKYIGGMWRKLSDPEAAMQAYPY